MTKQCARIPTNTSDFLSQRSRRECHSVRRLHAPVVKTTRTPLPCHNQRENCHFTRKEFHWKQTVSEVWGKRPLRCVLTTDTNNYIVKSVRISWREIFVNSSSWSLLDHKHCLTKVWAVLRKVVHVNLFYDWAMQSRLLINAQFGT